KWLEETKFGLNSLHRSGLRNLREEKLNRRLALVCFIGLSNEARFNKGLFRNRRTREDPVAGKKWAHHSGKHAHSTGRRNQTVRAVVEADRSFFRTDTDICTQGKF